MLITSAVILGWLGVLLYLGLALSFQKLAKLNEYALIHLIMAILYALWLPLPIALYMLLPSEPLMTGMIFGLAYLFMLIITMALQAGHIAYIMKTPSQQGEYMMATLSNPFEKLANLFKNIWALFLAIAFWTDGWRIVHGRHNDTLQFTIFLLFIFTAQCNDCKANPKSKTEYVCYKSGNVAFLYYFTRISFPSVKMFLSIYRG